MSVITESGLYHVILNAKTDRVKLKRGEDTAVCRKTFTGATAGQDIINGWRYTAEIQKYLDRCYREL